MRVKTDGLDALRAKIRVREIASLIERTARWVDPATFKLLPVSPVAISARRTGRGP